jgi:hypothetical protein
MRNSKSISKHASQTSVPDLVDILLPVHAEESRAVGVSGLTAPPNIQPVRVWQNVRGLGRVGLLGVPSPRYSYPPSYMDSQSCFCLGESGRLRQTRSYFRGACKQSGTALAHSRNQSFTGLVPDTVSLLGADRPPPQDESASAPFRLILTLLYGSLSLKRQRRKLRLCCRRWIIAHRVGFITRLKADVFALHPL